MRELGWVPLGLSLIASYLKQHGYEVSIFDRYAMQAYLGNDQRDIDNAMVSHSNVFEPDLIGFNTVSPLIHDTVKCASLIRKDYQGLMVAGGHHASALPQLTLERIPELNGVVTGEGEIVLNSLASGDDPSSIPGLWWEKGKSVHNGSAVQISEFK